MTGGLSGGCATARSQVVAALALQAAFATWLPQAGAATPEELSRQYSADWVSALGPIQVPPTSPDRARARRIAGRLARALGGDSWKVLVYRLSEMPRDMEWPAFALSGHYIAVSDWAALKYSDDMLAFTIAHEMGHVQLHHMDEIWRTTMACAHTSAETWTALSVHSSCAAPVMLEQELEADKFGYALAAQAGFDARRGARELLERLKDDEMHPPSAQRLANLGIDSNVLKDAGRIEK